jgi:hypothetical protein
MIDCVVARYHRNVDFVYQLPGIRRFCVYDKENPANPFNVPVNKGHEASVYLKHVVDHYDTLADFTFFIHDEDFSWHHSGSILERFTEAVESQRLFFNINDRTTWGPLNFHKADDAPYFWPLMEWYNHFIEPYIPFCCLPDPDFTRGHRSCAQFLVHKSRIHLLPREFYQALYDWILSTDLPSYATGRFLEWTWHIFWDIYPGILDAVANEQALRLQHPLRAKIRSPFFTNPHLPRSPTPLQPAPFARTPLYPLAAVSSHSVTLPPDFSFGPLPHNM